MEIAVDSLGRIVRAGNVLVLSGNATLTDDEMFKLIDAGRLRGLRHVDDHDGDIVAATGSQRTGD